VDAKKHWINKIYRIEKAGLKWKLLPAIVNDLVAYPVLWIKTRRTMAINLKVLPHVLFTEMQINNKKELEVAFVKITLIPQLDQGNEEVIRVALLTFGLKR
jgi:hypothetical protein